MRNAPQSTPGNSLTPRFATPATHQEPRRTSFALIPEENEQPSREETEPLEGLSYMNSPNHRPANPETNGRNGGEQPTGTREPLVTPVTSSLPSHMTIEIPIQQEETEDHQQPIQEIETPGVIQARGETDERQRQEEENHSQSQDADYGTPRTASDTLLNPSQQFQNATRVVNDTVPLRPEQLQETRQTMDDRRQSRQQLMQAAEQPMEGITANVHNGRVRDPLPHLDNDPINNNWRNRYNGRAPNYSPFFARTSRPYQTNNRPTQGIPEREPRRYADNYTPSGQFSDRTARPYQEDRRPAEGISERARRPYDSNENQGNHN
jgi:hypothetical protein